MSALSAIIMRNKKLYLFGAILMIFGFLLVFFYQILLESDIIKLKENYSFYSADKADKLFLISGWRLREEKTQEYASMTNKRAVFAISLPRKETVALGLIHRFHNPKQLIKVYCQERLLGYLRTEEPEVWTETNLIISQKLAKKGLNKIELVKSLDSEPDFKKVSLMNYKDKNLTFLRAYTVWESTQWFNKREGAPVNWLICIGGGVGLLILWLIYSVVLWFISNERYSFILELDFWTYLPAVVIFSLGFLIARVISTYSFFYYKLDYWLVLIGSISIGKIYQIIKHGKRDKLRSRIIQLRDNTIRKYNFYANLFIVVFMVMFLTCAVLLFFDMRLKAEWLADWSFLALIIGIVLKFIKYFIDKEYLNDE